MSATQEITMSHEVGVPTIIKSYPIFAQSRRSEGLRCNIGLLAGETMVKKPTSPAFILP